MRPSRYSFWTLRREFAIAIKLISLGSSQILPFPHFSTDAAKRFWSFSETVDYCEEEGDDKKVRKSKTRQTLV
jgi:hypothetical protein